MLHKVCYKSYLFLELKAAACADASIPMGAQGIPSCTPACTPARGQTCPTVWQNAALTFSF